MTRRRLGFNLNYVAVLRASRGGSPDPVVVAAHAETAGVDLVIVHLREDRRHIQERDARLLRQTVKTRLVLQMAGNQEMIKLAYDIKPDGAVLVPEVRDESPVVTPYDVDHHKEIARKHVQSLKDGDIDVSIFVAPEIDQVRAAHRIDAIGVVLDTGKYTDARGLAERAAEKQRLADAARAAGKYGLRVAVSGGLDHRNIGELTDIAEIQEFHVGHSVIARSLLVGLDTAVRDIRALIG